MRQRAKICSVATQRRGQQQWRKERENRRVRDRRGSGRGGARPCGISSIVWRNESPYELELEVAKRRNYSLPSPYERKHEKGDPSDGQETRLESLKEERTEGELVSTFQLLQDTHRDGQEEDISSRWRGVKVSCRKREDAEGRKNQRR